MKRFLALSITAAALIGCNTYHPGDEIRLSNALSRTGQGMAAQWNMTGYYAHGTGVHIPPARYQHEPTVPYVEVNPAREDMIAFCTKFGGGIMQPGACSTAEPINPGLVIAAIRAREADAASEGVLSILREAEQKSEGREVHVVVISPSYLNDMADRRAHEFGHLNNWNAGHNN